MPFCVYPPPHTDCQDIQQLQLLLYLFYSQPFKSGLLSIKIITLSERQILKLTLKKHLTNVHFRVHQSYTQVTGSRIHSQNLPYSKKIGSPAAAFPFLKVM